MTAADGETAISRLASSLEIPGYRLLQLIERGGMGEVYLAMDETLQRKVAVKIVLPDMSDDDEFRQRFAREAQTVAAFQHPNIVTIHASGRLQGKQYIVMEYLAGGTLHQKLEGGALPEASAVAIARHLADALAYAHEREVIHRDFKPRNVLIRQNGTPVLSDFGVAKSATTGGSQTVVGMVIGNIRYMAPEQARGEAVSDRIDIYSFGLILHEMLTGRLPDIHPIRDDADKTAVIQNAGKKWGDLIVRCLSAEPQRRPSAAECRDYLSSRITPPAGTAERGERHSLTATAVAAGIGVAVLAVVAAYFIRHSILSGSRSEPATTSATAPPVAAVTLSRQPSTARLFVDTNPVAAGSLAIDPGKHEIAAVAQGYYGEVRHVSVSTVPAATSVSFALEPTRLPSFEEEQRFVKLADATTISDSDLATVPEQTLNLALQTKRLRASGQLEKLQSVIRDVEILQRLGDTRAAVVILLTGSVQSGHIERSQITQSLLTASETGDPMATLFIAVAYRDSIIANGHAVASTDPLYRTYCRYLSSAIDQGWGEVASEYWRRDHCTR